MFYVWKQCWQQQSINSKLLARLPIKLNEIRQEIGQGRPTVSLHLINVLSQNKPMANSFGMI